MKHVLLLTILLGLFSCARTSVKDEVEAEIQALSDISSSSEMMSKSYSMIEDNPHLSEEKKEAFNKIKSEVHQEVQQINKRIAKIKIVLFRSLLNEPQRDAKTRHLTHELKRLHDRKLDIMIEAFFDLKTILGPDMLEPMLHERFHENIFRNYSGIRAGN